MAETRFDVGKLLQETEVKETEDGKTSGIVGLRVMCQIHMLRLLGENDQFVWSAKPSGSQHTHMYRLLSLHLRTPYLQLRAASASLVVRLLGSGVLFEHDPKEILAWIESLPRTKYTNSAGTEDDIAIFLGFFDDVLSRCVKTPYKYLEQGRQLYSSSGDVSRMPSPLFMALLEQLRHKPMESTSRRLIASFVARLVKLLVGKMELKDSKAIAGYMRDIFVKEGGENFGLKVVSRLETFLDDLVPAEPKWIWTRATSLGEDRRRVRSSGEELGALDLIKLLKFLVGRSVDEVALRDFLEEVEFRTLSASLSTLVGDKETMENLFNAIEDNVSTGRQSRHFHTAFLNSLSRFPVELLTWACGLMAHQLGAAIATALCGRIDGNTWVDECKGIVSALLNRDNDNDLALASPYSQYWSGSLLEASSTTELEANAPGFSVWIPFTPASTCIRVLKLTLSRIQDWENISPTLKLLLESLGDHLRPMSVNKLLQSVLHHSAFASICQVTLLLKDGPVSLLRSLFHKHPSSTCHPSHIIPLLHIYRGTLSQQDTQILSIFHLFEKSRQISTSDILRNWTPDPSHTQPKDFLSAVCNFNPSTMFRTCASFPQRRDPQSMELEAGDNRNDVYDPNFVLPLLVALMASEEPVTTVSSLSSKRPTMRQLGYAALVTAYTRLPDVDFQERNQLIYTLDLLRNLIPQPDSTPSHTIPRLPTYTTLLFSHALRDVFSPATPLYPLISRFLLQRPQFDPKDVPLLYTLLYSSSGEWRRERGWILRFLADGMRSTEDWKVLKRRHTWDLLASLFQSSIEDRMLRLSILEVLINAMKLGITGTMCTILTLLYAISCTYGKRGACDDRELLVLQKTDHATTGVRSIGHSLHTASDVDFQERNQLIYTLDLLRNLIPQPDSTPSHTIPRLPTYTTLLFSHALRDIFSPATPLYPLISRFLLQRPQFDPKDVPLLYTLLYSSSGEWRRERGWMLRFLADGMRSTEDWKVLKRRHTWDLLASLFQSSIEDRMLRLSILEVLINASANKHAATSLVLSSSIISWIHMQLDHTLPSEALVYLKILENMVVVLDHEQIEQATSGHWRDSVAEVVGKVVTSCLMCLASRILLRLTAKLEYPPKSFAHAVKTIMNTLPSLESFPVQAPMSPLSTDTSEPLHTSRNLLQPLAGTPVKHWLSTISALWALSMRLDVDSRLWAGITCRALFANVVLGGLGDLAWVRDHSVAMVVGASVDSAK
ncbi:nucleolar pre-ribosomal-associated protein 1 [Rhizoctonia solani]|uniref:Nucleolar pre-ribosomal-associated protein 1 n=1 Tax=Rhizoctonia solani TaxID=456999 RepID=A0A8H8P6L9_9AGAM|nr:nucleolar pre-ribosomal-associated protein 1 [Rhizoctonia solani]QRW25282.1 nucleolar pre-ribosomal-associated protein 1 [Rhizoctonia solani]